MKVSEKVELRHNSMLLKKHIERFSEARILVIGDIIMDEYVWGDVSRISSIDGHFALAAKQGRTVRLARTLGHPMRYFLGERFDGPHVVVAERVSQLRDYCLHNGMIEQFHPSYTRMVPAHYLVELQLVGCPEPGPLYRRFFAPQPIFQGNDMRGLGGYCFFLGSFVAFV